jgi:hypothetical protein
MNGSQGLLSRLMPVIVVVIVDALRADHLSCYSPSSVPSPNIDALADRGALFSRAISQSSWTRPSVASIMTGLYPSQHGLTDLARKGRGGRFIANGLDPNIPTLAERMVRAGYETAAFLEDNAHLDPQFGLTRGFGQIVNRRSGEGRELLGDFGRWLRRLGGGRAFAFLHLMEVHDPRPVKDSAFSRVEGIGSGSSALTKLYAAAVEQVDRWFGDLMECVKGMCGLEETFVALTADHGEELGDHGAMLAHGRNLHLEVIRVPMIIKLPSHAPSGWEIDKPVESIDLIATIAEVAGIESGVGAGRSLVSLMREADRGTDPAFSELIRHDRYCRSIVDERHHLIETFIFEEPSTAGATASRVGDLAAGKGAHVGKGRLQITRASRARGGVVKVRGQIEELDHERGTMCVAGIDFILDKGTKLIGPGKRSLDQFQLEVGNRVTVYPTDSERPLRARKVKLGRQGGKLKIQAHVEQVRDGDAGASVVTLLGRDVVVEAEATKQSLRDTIGLTAAPADVRKRIADADFLDRLVELYDLKSDPGELNSLARSRPAVVSELVQALDHWAESLSSAGSPFSGTVQVDDETVDQLRALGYID